MTQLVLLLVLAAPVSKPPAATADVVLSLTDGRIMLVRGYELKGRMVTITGPTDRRPGWQIPRRIPRPARESSGILVPGP